MATSTLQTSTNSGFIAQLNSNFEVEQLTRFIGSASDSSSDVLWTQYNETSSIYGLMKSSSYIYFFEYKVTDTMYVNTSSFSSWVAYKYTIIFGNLLSINYDIFTSGKFYSTTYTNGSDRNGIIFWKTNDTSILSYLQVKESGSQYFGSNSILQYSNYFLKLYLFYNPTNGCKCFCLYFSFYSYLSWTIRGKNFVSILIKNCFMLQVLQK